MSGVEAWRLVPGECNPADIGTRERDFVHLKNNHLFWFGPSILLSNGSSLPKPKESSTEAINEIQILGFYSTVNNNVSNSDIYNENLIDIERFISLEKLLKATSFVILFKNNLIVKVKKNQALTKVFIT